MTEKKAESDAGEMNKLVGFLEKLTKLSLILAALGYMSLRAHLNYLGITFTSSLGTERYVMEAYQFLSSVIHPVTFVVILFTILSVVIYPLVTLLRPYGLTSDLNRLSGSAVPILEIFVTVFLYVLFFKAIFSTINDVDIVVGSLKGNVLGRAQATKEAVGVIFYCLVFMCLMLFCTSKMVSASKLYLPKATLLRMTLLVLAVGLTLQLPLLYGRAIHSRKYPTVELQTEGASLSGLLVLESEKTYTIWSADKGVGVVTVVPKEKVISIKAGPVRDIVSEGLVAVAALAKKGILQKNKEVK